MTREEAINEIKSWDFLDEKEIEAIQTLIPELEENEDEKIIMTINNILPFIHDEAYTNNGTTKKDVLNWLEKQKEYVADNRKASTSYDDRIRKAIIKSIEEDSSVYEQEVSKEQMIAYLEKQKDASKAIEAVDRIDKYIDEHLANAHDMKDSNPDKKYYRGWDDALGKMAGILQDVYSNEKQKEQKHYWKPTETDVALFNKAVTTNNTLTPAERANLDIIRSKFSCCRAINCSGIMQKEQKPAEWSEEDEAFLKVAIAICNRYSHKDIADWLKSLRPSWKPSEEQPSLPDNLDEAAREIVIKMHPSLKDCTILGDRLTRGQLMTLVKAGAEWMAGQGVVSEGIINQTSGEDTMIELNEYIGNLEDCDEVIVQIRKKQ